MSAAGIRSKTTTIAQAQGPAANIHTARQSRETVPMREEIFPVQQLSTPDGVGRALQSVQRHINETTQATRSLPVLGGVYWADLVFVANVAMPFAHGITGRVAWIVGSVRPTGANAAAVTNGRIVEVSQDVANSRITLASNEACTADVWLFPKPGAAR